MNKKYKWDDWFGQGRVVLVRGVDYHCSQASFCGTVRNNASQRQLRVRVIDNGGSVTIEVKDASPHTDTPAVVGQPQPQTLGVAIGNHS